MSHGPVLVLGGTTEARELATLLHAHDVPVVTSLAGRVAAPRLPPGEVRIGGFGGADGLARWLTERRCAAVVDATHPFAVRMAANAAHAGRRAGVPVLRLERPGWSERPGDDWHRVADLGAAARAVSAMPPVPRGGAPRVEAGVPPRVLLALGRQELAAFAAVSDVWFLIRSIGPPLPPLPPQHELVLGRGPFSLEAERALLDRHAIDAVVTRDSGGDSGIAKLAAARELGLPVIVIARPGRPALPSVGTVYEAARWLPLVVSVRRHLQ